MTDVPLDDQRLMEEYVLRFFRRDPMQFPILLGVTFIPIKADTRFQWILSAHCLEYMPDIYAPCTCMT